MCGHVSMEHLSNKGSTIYRAERWADWEYYRKWPIVNQVCFRVILEPSSVLEFEYVKKKLWFVSVLLADDDIFQNVIINSQVKNEK